MKFQWDAEKSKANKRKHGIGFQEAQHLWLDDELVEIQAPHPLEKRKIVICRFGG